VRRRIPSIGHAGQWADTSAGGVQRAHRLAALRRACEIQHCMAAVLTLLSAVWFALAAALQQRGQFRLARGGTPVEGVGGLFRLLAVPARTETRG
jgi:hypothetical protein